MDCGGSGGGIGGWKPAYGIDGGNNIEDDPRFVDASGGDLHLLVSSHAIDAGTHRVPGLPAIDLDGNPRIQGGDIDMGAYEGGFSFVEATVTTDPANLDIILDGNTLTAPSIFMSRSGEIYEIGVVTPQVQGEIHYSFTGWSDAGDTIHTVIIPDDPIMYTASFSWAYLYAAIDSIVDVPGDQGGWARVYFRRSHYDNLSETVYPIERYDMHRRVDDPLLAAAVLAEGKLTDNGYIEYDGRLFVAIEDAVAVTGEKTAALKIPAAAPPGLWEVVGTVSASQQQQYIGLAPTLADSAATIPYTAFYVSAHSTTPAVYFDSPPDSGYSVDNIAPGVPLGLAAAYNTGSGNQLTWDPSPEPDFQYYCIYRGDEEGFVPGPGNLVHQTATAAWTDPEYDGWDVYYKVTALDYVGNESDAASPDAVTGDDPIATPTATYLAQNYPNPFNPQTTIAFGLKENGHVSLRIYDTAGRLVVILIDETRPAGNYASEWNGLDKNGSNVASGVYFYRIIAGEFEETRKMILLR
jgi:hypothetical protein